LKPNQLILACYNSDPSVAFRILADSVYMAQLRDGRMLRDISDFKAWLVELAEELETSRRD
jgi:hypothetical protein